MFKGAIFDADGTLLDSMSIWRELGCRYLSKHNIKAESKLADILYPMSLSESSAYLKKRYHLNDTAEEITADIIDMIRSFYLCEVTLKRGVADYLTYLHNRKIPAVVASSNDKDLLYKVFKRHNISGFFCDIITCDSIGVDKLDPEIYLHAAETLGLPPKNIAVFEDMPHAVKTAKDAGFITVAVNDTSNLQCENRLRETADYFIDDFTEEFLQEL